MSDKNDDFSVGQGILLLAFYVFLFLALLENFLDFINDRGGLGFYAQLGAGIALGLCGLCDVKPGKGRKY